MEIVIASQKDYKTLIFAPIGYKDKVSLTESQNTFIKESERTSFEFIGNGLDGNLDRLLTIAIEQKIKNVWIGVTITSSISKLSILKIENISFESCVVDFKLLPIFENAKYLTIGNSVKMDISSFYFPNLVDIAFLSLKTFKGDIIDKIKSIKKLVIWFENKKLNGMLPMIPNLKHLEINNGSMVELDLSTNAMLETLSLHRCLKVERVLLAPSIELKTVVVESCKWLDQSNLGENIQNW